MRKQIKFLFLLGIVVLTAYSCEEEELETDPKKVILGKWEITHLGGIPIDEPSVYVEYLADSILKIYEYETGEITTKKYWIDSLLHESTPREDGVDITLSSEYQFSNKNNTLELNVQAMAIFHKSVYKRIK